jgi:uncharacterized protein (TIGR02145 family)
MKSIRSFSFFLLVLIVSIAFTACKTTPLLTTTEVSAITQTSATSGGNITSDEGSSVTARGVCWSTKANPTIGDSKTTDGGGIGSFSSSISGLTANTTYYVRAYATTSSGTGYGGAYQITTIVATPTVTDADGNIYHSITIGTQIWMVENLKTTHYRNGDLIPNITDNNAWDDLETGATCDFDNKPRNSKTYGKLYNWYAVCDSRNIAPAGWHVPTDAEWKILTDYLGGRSVAGGKLKETGTTYWKRPNIGATNESGFSALPGGHRNDGDGTFTDISCFGQWGFWWSSTESSSTLAWLRGLAYNYRYIDRQNYTKSNGYSVRCVRDVESEY